MESEEQVNSENVAEYLQKLVLDSEQAHDFLGQLAVHAAESLSRHGTTIHCGVTLLRQRRAATAASSSPKAKRMNEVQYRYDEGPCLSAARIGQVFHVPDLVRETRWPEYLHEIQDTGVGSILAVPFDLSGEALGALNLYAEEAQAFDEDTRILAAAYASQASNSLRLAVRITQLADTMDDLKSALASRTGIDVAVGIVMAQNRCTQDEAFAILQRASNTRNIKLRDVATRLVDSVSPGDVETHFDG